jgi:oligopeptidase B
LFHRPARGLRISDSYNAKHFFVEDAMTLRTISLCKRLGQFLVLALFTPAVFAQSTVAAPAAAPVTKEAKTMQPPVAKKDPKVFEKFGDKRVDDYFWLREKSNPAVTDYLKAENAYTESVLGGLKGFQETLYKDMLSRIKETDENVPYRSTRSTRARKAH